MFKNRNKGKRTNMRNLNLSQKSEKETILNLSKKMVKIYRQSH